MENLSLTLGSIDISFLVARDMASTPKKRTILECLGLDCGDGDAPAKRQHLLDFLGSREVEELLKSSVEDDKEDVVATNDGPRVYPQLQIPVEVPPQVIWNEELVQAPDPLPDGARAVAPPQDRNVVNIDRELVRVIGQDRGLPGLLVTNAAVTQATQHHFELLIGFSREHGDRSAALLRNGLMTGSLEGKKGNIYSFFLGLLFELRRFETLADIVSWELALARLPFEGEVTVTERRY